LLRFDQDQSAEKRVRIKVDYSALYGVSATSITEGVEALASGRVVSQILDGPRHFDVIMRLGEAQRSTTALRDLLIATPSGSDGRSDLGQAIAENSQAHRHRDRDCPAHPLRPERVVRDGVPIATTPWLDARRSIPRRRACLPMLGLRVGVGYVLEQRHWAELAIGCGVDLDRQRPP
jgi:HME family heavy-metal exporter